MPIRTPYHSTMEKEIEKAAKIVDAFFDSALDQDSAIPADLIRQCAGLAFLTVVKAGVIWTGKVGTGIVVARLPDGSWSPPSGIGTAGVGFGAEFGGELIDFMIVLGSATAVQTFKKGTQVSLGAGLDLAVGPIGRTAGANLNASRGGFSGNYTYSHSKGMFAGVGLHGSTIVVRNDLNSRFYGQSVTPMEILGGHVQMPPGACDLLYAAINRAINSEACMFETTVTDYQNRSSAPSRTFSSTYSSVPPAASLSEHPERSASFDNSRSRRSSDASANGSRGRSSTSGLPPPTTAAPIENDPRLRRYSSYKSERELYAEFARNKSASTDYAAGYAAPAASTNTYAPPAPAAGYAAGYGMAAQPAPVSAPVAAAPAPQQVNYVPASAYTPYAAPAAPAAPRAQAPPIPPPTSGGETKQVYTGVMQFVTSRCPHANLQIFKDNCRRFGQDQMSLDAYFAYLSSICTAEQLKELMPHLVRLLPTQDKREKLWAVFVRDVLWIR